MPEGNEIHRWAERHNAAFAGRRMNVLPGPGHRFHDAHLVDGKKLMRVHAVGKHLGYEFENGLILHVHLGRFGDWTEGLGPLPEPRGALRAVLQRARSGRRSKLGTRQPGNLSYRKDDGTQPFPPAEVDWIELRGPTDCSVFDPEKWQKLLARLGPDPLGEDARGHDNPRHFVDAVLASRKSIAELLMDQEVLSGVGNIYRAEILFLHRVNPFTPGEEMDPKVLKTMWKDLIPLLKDGMLDRRIVCTKRVHRPSKKQPAQRGEEHYVYRRQGKPCFVCGQRILHRDLAGRTLFWCPGDQNTTAAQNGQALKPGVSLRASRAAAKARRAGVFT